MKSIPQNLSELFDHTDTSNQHDLEFQLTYPGNQTSISDRRLDVCLYKLRDQAFNISKEETLKLSKIFSEAVRLIANNASLAINSENEYSNQQRFRTDDIIGKLYKALEGDFSCVAEPIFLSTKKYCEIFWSEPTIEFNCDENQKVSFCASFKIGSPPVIEKTNCFSTSMDELQVYQILNEDEVAISREEDLDNREVFIYLTNSNPTQFRSVFKSAIIQKWNDRFEKNASCEKNLLIENIQYAFNECNENFQDVNMPDELTVQSILECIVDKLLYKSKPYIVCKNSGNQHGSNWTIISKVIDNVYLSLDPSVLSLAGQNFPRLTWTAYGLTMEHESEIMEAKNLYGGLAPLYYPATCIDYHYAGFSHELVKNTQEKLINEFSKSTLIWSHIKENNERFLLRLINLIVGMNQSRSFVNTDESHNLDAYCKFWAETFEITLNFDPPILPLDSHLVYGQLDRQLKYDLITPAILANSVRALHEFKALSAKKRNGLKLRTLMPFFVHDMLENTQHYRSPVTTKIRMEFLLNNVVSLNYVNSEIENSHILKSLNEKLDDYLIDIGNKSFKCRIEVSNKSNQHYYENLELNSEFSPRVSKLFLKFISASGAQSLPVIDYLDYRSKGVLNLENQSSNPELVKNLILKVDEIFSQHPIFSSILIGVDESVSEDIFNPLAHRDSWYPISLKGLTFTQSSTLIKSLMYSSDSSIALVPSIIANMQDPYHIAANGQSILDIAIIQRDLEILDHVYKTYIDLGADESYLNRSFNTALGTYDPQIVEIALRYSNGISDDQCNLLYKWDTALTISLETLICTAKMKNQIFKNPMKQKDVNPVDVRKRTNDIL